MDARFLALAAGVSMLVWAWYQRYVQASGGPDGPIPTVDQIQGKLIWGDPTINGMGIRSAQQPANVTIDISGMRPGDPYLIQNRKLHNGEVVSQSEAIVPSSGRVLLEDIQTPVPWWEPGDYEVVLVYFAIVLNLHPGFRIVHPSGGQPGTDPYVNGDNPFQDGEPWDTGMPDRDPWNPDDDPFRWDPFNW